MEAKTIDKIIFDINGEEYELSGGGGGQPDHNSVGTEEIKDGAVEMEDLNADVKNKMTNRYDAQGEGIVLGGIVADTQSGGQGGFPNEMEEEEGD